MNVYQNKLFNILLGVRRIIAFTSPGRRMEVLTHEIHHLILKVERMSLANSSAMFRSMATSFMTEISILYYEYRIIVTTSRR